MRWRDVCYEYDGSFAGFLTCLFEGYRNREEAVCFLGPEDTAATLWDTRRVDTDQARAVRVWRGICRNISPAAGELARRAFLTCLPQREVCIWQFLRYGFERGSAVMADLGDDRVNTLRRAVQQLDGEAHLYKGFVRFSDQDGVLTAVIEPKNRVLPVLRAHFTARLNTQCFLIYDRTHREALLYRPRQWAIVPAQDFQMGAPDQRERQYRRLWRAFFETVAIRERTNPRCQNTHLPKRYRAMMTEFQPPEDALPEGK